MASSKDAVFDGGSGVPEIVLYFLLLRHDDRLNKRTVGTV